MNKIPNRESTVTVTKEFFKFLLNLLGTGMDFVPIQEDNTRQHGV